MQNIWFPKKCDFQSTDIHTSQNSSPVVFQLFGEDDPDQDVSPDTEDPEAEGDKAGQAAADKEANKVSSGVFVLLLVYALVGPLFFFHF